MVRRPCCEMSEVKKGPWSPEEDLMLVSYVQDHGAGNWRVVPANTGLKRCSKSCRLRWTNYLRPGIKRGNFSDQEDKLIIELQKLLGNRWSMIASHMPERTDNDIKNYWNTHLKKKLTKTKGDRAATPTNKGVFEEALSMDIASPAIKLQPLPLVPLPTLDISPAMYASSIENITHLLKANGWMGSSAGGKASVVSPVSDDGEVGSGSHSSMTCTLEGFTEMTKVEGSGGAGLGPSSSFPMMESWLLDDGLGHSDASLIGVPLTDLLNFF